MDITEPPIRVASLAAVPKEYRALFRPADDGDGFVCHLELHPDIVAMKEQHAAEMAAREKQLAELEASVARNRELNRSEAASTAIASALAENGVPVGLRKAAAAVLSRDLKLAYEERDYAFSVSVDTPHGRTSVEHGVKTWLAGEEGAAFARPRPREIGKFTSAIRGLRDGLH